MEEVDEETVGIIIELSVGQYELPVSWYELRVSMELPVGMELLVGQYELPVSMNYR